MSLVADNFVEIAKHCDLDTLKNLAFHDTQEGVL